MDREDCHGLPWMGLSSSRPGSKNRPSSDDRTNWHRPAFGSMERRALLLLVMLRRQRRVRAP